MNKAKKKGMIVNIVSQCVIYISVAVFLTGSITGIELPDAIIFILMTMDILTIPAFIHSYIKAIENEKS